MRQNMRYFFFLVVLLSSLPRDARAGSLEFDLVFQTKCVFDDVIFESDVLLKFNAYQNNNREVQVPLNIRVHDPNGKEILNKLEQSSLETTLTNMEEGRYKVCFTAKNYHTAQTTRILISWEEGVESKNWDQIAKKDKTDAVHTELLRLEEQAHTMHYELQHIRRQEEKMRDINERTNALVAFLSIGALFVCVGLASFQVWSLKKFFKRKKVL